MEREKEIVLTKVPDITENLADQVARVVRRSDRSSSRSTERLRGLFDEDACVAGVEKIDEQTAASTINIS